MQLFMHSVLIHNCLYGNNQSVSVGKEFHTTLSNFKLQSKMFCLNFLNFISNYSKLRVKMAWPRHVISKRIINCQKVQFLILIQARPFSCYTSARARKQVFQIKSGCSSYMFMMYYHSLEMSSSSSRVVTLSCQQVLLVIAALNVINNEPGLPYSSVNQIKLLCKALSVVNPGGKENEILQDLVHVAMPNNWMNLIFWSIDIISMISSDQSKFLLKQLSQNVLFIFCNSIMVSFL